MNERERFNAVMLGRPFDRLPLLYFGTWPETKVRWKAEGLGVPMRMGSNGGPQLPGMDTDWECNPCGTGEIWDNQGLLDPAPRSSGRWETLSEDERTRTVRTPFGGIVQSTKAGSSVSHVIQHDLEPNRESWLRFKRTLDPADPARWLPGWEARAAALNARSHATCFFGGSLYGWVRDRMGVDAVSHALGLSVSMPALPLVATATGPVLARVAGTGAFGTRSTLHLTYSVVAGIPWLFADLDVDWREDASWLRFRLPTMLRGRSARYGTPFGSVLRPAQAGDDAQQAQWEVPGSRWAAVTDDGGDGAAIISDAKFGWSCDNGVLHLSLLRAPNSPAPGADRGRHHIRFAIGRHRTNSDGGAQTTAADADLLYLPVPTYCGAPSGPAPISLLPGSSLAPAWVLPSSGGGLLRLHEVSGQRGTAMLCAAGSVPWLADIRGNPVSPLTRDDRDIWRLPYSPYQLISVTLTRDRPSS